MNKQPPAIVRVRVRGGIVRIPGQQASRQTITIVTANFKDARNKRWNRNTRSPTEIICFLNFSAWAMVENNVFRYFRIFQKNRSACADFDYGGCDPQTPLGDIKEPPASVRVRARGGIERRPGQQASRQTITKVTANSKDAPA